MNNNNERSASGEWVIHIDIKIWGTVVWETVIGGFPDKADAETWQKQFMKVAPLECASALIFTEDAMQPALTASPLRQEINRYLNEMMEE